MEWKTLPIDLTEEDLNQRRDMLVSRIQEREDVLEEKRASSDSFKEKLREIGGDITSLSRQIRTRKDERVVGCMWERDDARLLMVLVRQDTGEIVESRPMDEAERQTALFTGERAPVPSQSSDGGEVSGGGRVIGGGDHSPNADRSAQGAGRALPGAGAEARARVGAFALSRRLDEAAVAPHDGGAGPSEDAIRSAGAHAHRVARAARSQGHRPRAIARGVGAGAHRVRGSGKCSSHAYAIGDSASASG